MFWFLILTWSACFTQSSSSLFQKQQDHSVFMDEAEKFKLLWTVDELTSTISFTTIVNTTGWVGFGIAKGLSGKMHNADIAIGYVTSDGRGHLTDRHAVGETLPPIDDHQDFILTGFQETNGQTILHFNRSIKSCDRHDNNIQIGTTKLLYAYHEVDPSADDESTVSYHGSRNRGSRSVNLLNYVHNEAVTEPNTKHIDILMPNVTLPTKDTIYWCTPHKITQEDLGGEKRHVIEISPIIQPGHEGLVHHIALYECGENFINDTHLDISNECKSPNMPPEVQKCLFLNILYVWAVGGETFKLPKKAGIPLGLYEHSYYVMEIHYDNQDMKAGLVDSSGFRFTLADNLRQYDASTLTTGLSSDQNLFIPPQEKSWITAAYCMPSCSKKFGDSENGSINIFAAFPHLHTTGSGLWTKLIRDGEEITEIIRDDNYDFNYQQTHLLPNEVTMKAGDSLATYCRFNSESRSQPTFGGESTKEEMCLSFLLYYPRVNVTSCSSDNQGVGKFHAKYAPSPKKMYGRNIYNWDGIPWSKSKSEELREVLEDSKIVTQCFAQQSRIHMDVSFKVFDQPVYKPLPVPDDKCQGSGSSSGVSLRATLLVVGLSALCSVALAAFS